MARRLKKLIKVFDFPEENRELITLGPNVRLNPETHRIQLKADADGKYPTTANLYAKTWVANPESVKAWSLFQADDIQKKNFSNVVVTAIKYRLSTDGTNELYWNGAAWAAAAAGQWNTEAEVSAHIGSLPVANRKIQIVMNLSTTDPACTPELSALKVLLDSDIEWLEEYIYRTLVRQLRAQVRPIAEYVVISDGTASVSLAKVETPYNIAAIDSAYNVTTDANEQTNIAGAYNTGTKVLTLTSTPTSGQKVKVRFTYEPEIAVTTDEDFVEVAKVPGIILNYRNGDFRAIGEHESVVDRATGSGYQLAGGYMDNIELTFTWIADKSKDATRIGDEVQRFLSSNTLIRAPGQDELFRLQGLEDFAHTSQPNQKGLVTGRLSARLVNALFYAADAKPVTAVMSFQVTGGNLAFQV